jgi:peptidyl-prolyl cis-trans isomerase C
MTGNDAAAAGDEAAVYYSTDVFEVTGFDLQMYLRGAPPPPDGTIGSRARNLQALSDLYAMEMLAADAASAGLSLVTESERAWIADYAVRLEVVRRYVSHEVNSRLESTDWNAEAAEVYLADPEAYRYSERVSIRSLLIKTGDRSIEDAMLIASDLLVEAKREGADFAQLVSDNTEDEAARANGGLMVDVGRGQTVAPFEAAAFALREPGELSQPVVSRFGVHLIQLVTYQASRQRTLDEAREQIIAGLRPRRANQYRDAIQSGARERKRYGFVEHTDALDALMLRTSDGPLGID